MAGQPALANTARQMITNRHRLPLDPAERLAEGADRRRMREAAHATVKCNCTRAPSKRIYSLRSRPSA